MASTTTTQSKVWAQPQVFELACGRIAALRRHGPDPLVLLLHGNSSCKEVFAPSLAALAPRPNGLLAIDLPGHGQSDDARDPEATYTLPGYAAVVRELLDRIRAGRVVLIGWSLGGHIAVELLGSDPRIIGAMIIGAPPATPSRENFLRAFRTGTRPMELTGKPAFTAEEARRYGVAMLGGAHLLDDFLLERIRRTDGRARARVVESCMQGLALDHSRIVEREARPLAVIQGERDPFINLPFLQSMSFAGLWRGGVQVLEGVGHAPHWEGSARFEAALTSFVDDVGGAMARS